MRRKERIKRSLSEISLPLLLPYFPPNRFKLCHRLQGSGCAGLCPPAPRARWAVNSVPQGWAGRKEVKWDILKIQDILVLQTRNGPGLPTKALEEEGLAPSPWRASMRMDVQWCN